MAVKKPLKQSDVESPFQAVLPKTVKAGKDRLLMRLNFYTECIQLQGFDKDGKGGKFRIVDPRELTKALSSGISFTSGLLPGAGDSSNVLWVSHGKGGQIVAVWLPPGVRRVALQLDSSGAPKRYNIPLPGLIFLCRPGQPPRVYAATERPSGLKDKVFAAPLANVYEDGRSCPGTHRYPGDVGQIPDSFFRSFFTRGANLGKRSKKHAADITLLWKELDGKKEYPVSDLVYHGIVNDLMVMSV